MKSNRLDDRHYLPTLDGWRAVGILIVILSHGPPHVFGRFTSNWFAQNGRTGVDIFFALSGLLICTRLLREESRTGSIDLRSFYIRRLFRIQPAAWLYLLILGLLMVAGVISHAFAGVAYALLLVRNYLPLHFPPRDWYTAHFWSLSVEEHFYLLLPGFLLLVRRRRAAVLLTLSAVLICWLRLQWRFPGLDFGWAPEDHTENAVIGILLACAYAVLLRRPQVRAVCDRWLNPYVTLAVALVLAVASHHVHHFVVDVLLLAVFPLVLISTMLHPHSLPSRTLEWAPLRFIGALSYSLYLWQMLFFAPVAVSHLAQGSWLAAIQQTAGLRYLAVLLCSMVSYYALERPLVRVGHRLTRRSGTAGAHGDAEHDTAAAGVV